MNKLDFNDLTEHYEKLLKRTKDAQLKKEYHLNKATSMNEKAKVLMAALKKKSMKQKLIEVAKTVKHRQQSHFLHYFRQSAKNAKTVEELRDAVKLAATEQLTDLPFDRAIAKKAIELHDFKLAIEYFEKTQDPEKTPGFEKCFDISVFYRLMHNKDKADYWEKIALEKFNEKKHDKLFTKDGYRKYVIHVTEDYTLEFYKWKGRARGAIASFDTIELTYKSTLFSKYYVNNQQLDIIALRRNRLNYFYENITNEQYKALVEPIFSQYNENYAYGTSLAGYCAVYFGAVIPNVRILAFSPRNSAHPNYGMSRNIQFGHQLQLPTIKAPVVLLYDPKNHDDELYYQQQLKPALKDVERVPVYYAGHRVPRYFRETKELRSIFEAFFRHEPITPLIDRKKKGQSPEYFLILGEQLTKHGHYEAAIKSCDTSLKLLPEFDRPLYQKAVALRALGRLEEGVVCLETALENGSKIIKFVYLLSELYNDLGQSQKAVEVLTELTKRHSSKQLTERLEEAQRLAQQQTIA